MKLKILLGITLLYLPLAVAAPEAYTCSKKIDGEKLIVVVDRKSLAISFHQANGIITRGVAIETAEPKAKRVQYTLGTEFFLIFSNKEVRASQVGSPLFFDTLECSRD